MTDKVMFNDYGEPITNIGILRVTFGSLNGIKALRVSCGLHNSQVTVSQCWSGCEYFDQVVGTRFIKCKFGIEHKRLDLNKIRMVTI